MSSNPRSTDLPWRFALATGVALLFLSGAIIFGWLARIPEIVQVLPGAPAMRFNTAVCLLLLGIAVVSLSRHRIWLPRCLASAIALVGAMSLSQDLLGINWGIDNLIFDDWHGVGPNASGRMAANTAVCFIVSGISVASLSTASGHRFQPLLECICGSVAFAIGTVSDFGYLLGLEGAYGWGGNLGMAVHTATSFAVVGITLIWLALVHQAHWSSGLPPWLPLPVFLGAATIALGVCQAIRLDEQKQMSHTAQARAEKLAAQITSRLTARVQSLERMASRWATAGRPRQEYWEADARESIKHFSDFQSIAWIDPEERVAWLVQRDPNSVTAQVHNGYEAARSDALRCARQKRGTAITPAIARVPSGIGGQIFCPIFRDEQLEGYLSATFGVHELVSDLAREDSETGYQVVIGDDSQKLFSSSLLDVPAGHWSESSLDYGGIHWHARMCLTPRAALAQRSRLPLGVLCCGLLFATVLGMAIYYALRADERSRAAAFAAAELHATQARFRAIFDQTFQFIGLVSPDGTVLEVNRTALEFAGITEADVLGRPFWETPWWTHSPELQQRLRAAIVAAAGGAFQRFEATHPASNGQTHYVDFSLKPVRDDNGHVTMLIPEGRDVTDRIQAEQRLRESQERFELAVRGSSDGIWDWNLETDDIYYSPRFKELLGYDESSSLNWKDAIHPADRDRTLSELQAHLEHAAPFDVTCRLLARDNLAGWFRIRGQATCAESGRARRMAGSLSDMTALKKVEEQLICAARLDSLTGLPNRALLLDRLQYMMARALRAGNHNYAVMFLDFDRFKIINDSLGHEVGDSLLRVIADRLRSCIRSVDSVSRAAAGHTTARLGGDEFVVVLDDLTQLEDIQIVANRLLDTLSQPYQLGDHEVYCTASIGIVKGSEEYESADDLLRDADTAMYEAKHTGKARYVVFDDSMRKCVQRRLQLENDLRKAIGSNQLSLAFQPIVSLDTGEICCVEALLRWRHPVEGMIGPAEFIPIAEECGLIHALGDWVLKTGCQQMAEWVDALGARAPAMVSINLSRKQFAHPNLYECIRQALADTRLPADRLQLEITEVTFDSSIATAIETMHGLCKLGIHLAVDDYGIGSSSLAAVHQFPISMLKVDRSFLMGTDDSPETAAMIHALTVLAANLEIKLVVEGVETLAQVHMLRKLECQYAQGFFLAKPMAADEFEELVCQGISMERESAGAR